MATNLPVPIVFEIGSPLHLKLQKQIKPGSYQ